MPAVMLATNARALHKGTEYKALSRGTGAENNSLHTWF